MVHWIAEKIKLTDLQKEGLEEIGNIGSGQSTDYISDIVKKKVEIKTPDMGVVPLSKSKKSLLDEFEKDEPIFNVFVPITGLNGGITVSLPKEQYIELIELIENQIDEEYTLMELSEDIAKCYLEAVNNFLDESLGFGDGKVFYMPINTLLSYLSKNIINKKKSSEYDTDALIINTDFEISDNIEGKIILIVDIIQIERLTDALDQLLKI